MEEAITGDFSLVKAWKADPFGNLVFHHSAQNFNPVIAKAGRFVIAEVEEIVPIGTLNPNQIHLPGIYIHRLIQGEKYEKRIERLTLTQDSGSVGITSKKNENEESLKRRERIVKRAAKEFKDGMYGK